MSRSRSRTVRVTLGLGLALALAVTLGLVTGTVLTTERDEAVRPVPSGADVPARAWAGPDGTGPSPGRCRGVDVDARDDAFRVMERHPPGTTFCLGPGVHRLTRPLRPQEGDTLQGRVGAVLNGAAVLTGWRQVAEGWQATGRLPDEPSDAGECLSEQRDCTLTEDVFLDGRRLVRASSAEAVTPGSFFADYSTGAVTLGDDPSGRLVEQAVAPALVRSSHSSVTVRDLVLEMAANPAQEAAVDGRTESPATGSRWRVLHNLVRLNHGVGIGIGTRGVVRGNEVREQGQLGVSVWERGARVLDNLVVENGTAGYDPDWEAGGLKAWVTEDVQIIGNHVHGNRGPGLWSDGGCLRTTYRRNVITQNWGAGIQHEISYDARIVRNRISDNGLRHKGWAWEAGISIQSSGGLGRIVVARNRVSGGAHGIMVLESGDRRREWPSPHGPHVVRDVLVRRNTVTLREGQWTGVVQDVGDHGVFSRDIRFVGNVYHLESAAQRPFAWRDDQLSWARWRTSAGQDRRGSVVVP